MNKFISIFFLAWIAAYKSFACDCEGPSSDIEKYWKSADQIFIGEVMESTSDKLYTASGLNYPFYTIRVVEPLKGHFHPKFKLRTFEYAWSCDYYFEVGKKYLIYATESNSTLSTAICRRTFPIEEVDKSELEELRQLTKYYGEEKRPTVVVEKTEAERELEIARTKIEELNNTRNWLLGTALTLGLLTVLSIVAVIRRKKDEVQHGS